jgi:hypothetical protein
LVAVGTYPQIDGYDALNAEIVKSVDTAYGLATDQSYTDDANIFNVSYAVTENGRYAKIDLTYNYKLTDISMTPYTQTASFYVDKDSKSEITADDYTKATTDATPTPAPATSETAAPTETADNSGEVVMVHVRPYAEALGYTVTWYGDTQTVALTKGDERYTVTVGVNEYLVNGEITALEVAPTNQDGYVYVPVSFFEQVLGATYSVDTDGNIVITAAAEPVSTQAPEADVAA